MKIKGHIAIVSFDPDAGFVLLDKMPLSAESKVLIRTLIDLDFTHNVHKK